MANRTLAERLRPGRPAVGRVLTFPRSGGDRTVIGVVDDVRYYGLAEAARPLAYLPLAQRFFPQAPDRPPIRASSCSMYGRCSPTSIRGRR